MAFCVWVELVCTRCARQGAGRHTYDNVPRISMQKEAVAAGWVLKQHDWFCSAQCRDQYFADSAKVADKALQYNG